MKINLVKINLGVFGKVLISGSSPAKEEGEGRGTVRSNCTGLLSFFLRLLHSWRQHLSIWNEQSKSGIKLRKDDTEVKALLERAGPSTGKLMVPEVR